MNIALKCLVNLFHKHLRKIILVNTCEIFFTDTYRRPGLQRPLPQQSICEQWIVLGRTSPSPWPFTCVLVTSPASTKQPTNRLVATTSVHPNSCGRKLTVTYYYTLASGQFNTKYRPGRCTIFLSTYNPHRIRISTSITQNGQLILAHFGVLI